MARHLLTFLQLFFLALGLPPALGYAPLHERGLYATTCASIAASISSASAVYYPGELNYVEDVAHFAANAAQVSACSVEPGTADDLAIIIQAIGNTRTPFAVKGGGHSSNQNFSSTPGVQIAMSRFSDITYYSTTSTVDIGAGLIWDDVYATLPPLGVNVVGGRVSGVGVAGFTLGGGYSYKSNQYGLTSDNMVSFEIVLASGSVVTPNATSYSDLFWALRGAGQVNFGIVTKFTMKAYAQTQVYGGYIAYGATEFEAVAAATYNFTMHNNDPLASILPTFSVAAESPIAVALLFYDTPTPASGTFDGFFDIPYLFEDMSTRSYQSLVRAAPSNVTMYSRGAFDTVPLLNITLPLLQQVINQTLYWGSRTGLHGSAYISIDVEPFLPTLFQHSDGGAYPHSTSDPLLPLCLYFTWESPLDDAYWQAAIKEAANVILEQAIAEGQPLNGPNVVLYNNYAPADTPLDRLYGTNLAQLQSIHSKYDPNNVMGLTGGFKV